MNIGQKVWISAPGPLMGARATVVDIFREEEQTHYTVSMDEKWKAYNPGDQVDFHYHEIKALPS